MWIAVQPPQNLSNRYADGLPQSAPRVCGSSGCWHHHRRRQVELADAPGKGATVLGRNTPGRIRSAGAPPDAEPRWRCRRRLPPRSSGPAHWYRARSRTQQAGGIEIDRHRRELALEKTKATGGQGLLRPEGPHLDVVTHQLETDAAAQGQTQLLAQVMEASPARHKQVLLCDTG